MVLKLDWLPRTFGADEEVSSQRTVISLLVESSSGGARNINRDSSRCARYVRRDADAIALRVEGLFRVQHFQSSSNLKLETFLL